MSELRVRGLRKSFGQTAVLRGVDLTVPRGTLAAVLGPSGCGKTTLLRIVAGFLAADAGTVTLAGRVVSGQGHDVPPERRRVGVVPQEGALFPHLSVAQNVGFGLSRAQRRTGRIGDLLALVGLDGFAGRMPGELSGGQQQRVALARALAPEPELVLLDEPFSALDTALRAALREDVRQALRAAGATAVLVTHDQQEALSMASLVAVLRNGEVVQCAPPAELYRRPGDVGVATFVGEAVVLPAQARAGHAETVLGRLPIFAPATGPVADGRGTVVLRPEQVRVLPPAQGMPARVIATTYYGHDALVQLRVQAPDGSALSISARSSGHEVVAEDTLVGIDVTGDVAFFPDGSRPYAPSSVPAAASARAQR